MLVALFWRSVTPQFREVLGDDFQLLNDRDFLTFVPSDGPFSPSVTPGPSMSPDATRLAASTNVTYFTQRPSRRPTAGAGDDNSSGHLDGPAIAGILIGVVLLVGIASAIITFFIRQGAKTEAADPSQSHAPSDKEQKELSDVEQ
jgi:hypothetical protein